MKKIIEGKRYDTETAEQVAFWQNDYSLNDLVRGVTETLYRTKKGTWFLIGEGGALSVYAIHKGNSTHGDSKLIPMTSVEAMNWMEEHDLIEALEVYFEEDIKDA